MCIRRDVVFLIVQEDGAGVVDMKIPERARIVQSAYQESKMNVNYNHPSSLTCLLQATYRTYLYKHGAPHPSPSSTCRVPQEKKTEHQMTSCPSIRHRNASTLTLHSHHIHKTCPLYNLSSCSLQPEPTSQYPSLHSRTTTKKKMMFNHQDSEINKLWAARI